MLAFVGDLHGVAPALKRACNKIAEEHPEVETIIQVGDFGWYPKTRLDFEFHSPYARKVYTIDGNHEDFNLFEGLTEVTEIWPGLFFVPRGTVLELDGRRILFMGGAASVDKAYRQAYGRHWDGREEITDAQMDRVAHLDRGDIDIMVTHVPPQSVIEAHFDPNALLMFGLPSTWIDPSAVKIEKLWNRLGQPKLFCGHMHKSVKAKTAQILDINEVVYY